jgi:hypothetical protein
MEATVVDQKIDNLLGVLDLTLRQIFLLETAEDLSSKKLYLTRVRQKFLY